MNNRAIIPRAGRLLPWRALLLALAAVLLSACSATRLAYNQAPSLTYWWIDRQVDLSETQAEPVRQDVDRFFEWHRRSELPAYADTLQRWQALVLGNISAEQACTEFERVRARLDTATERSLEPLARLALQLSPEQLQQLQRSQSKGNEEYEDDFVRGSLEERRSKRLEKSVERSEMLYGSLNEEQRNLVLQSVKASPFDAERSYRERLRRQEDLRQTVRSAQALAGTEASATATARSGQGVIRSAQAAALPTAVVLPLLRAYNQRVWQSPTPGYSAYSQTLVRQGCAQFAALHNSTSPEQRAHAVGVLKGYETDLRALASQKP